MTSAESQQLDNVRGGQEGICDRLPAPQAQRRHGPSAALGDEDRRGGTDSGIKPGQGPERGLVVIGRDADQHRLQKVFS